MSRASIWTMPKEAVANGPWTPPYTISMPVTQPVKFCNILSSSQFSSVHAWITHLMLDNRRKDIGGLCFLQRVMKTARWDANDDEIVNTDMLLENIPE
jgi:hypothetical protein